MSHRGGGQAIGVAVSRTWDPAARSDPKSRSIRLRVPSALKAVRSAGVLAGFALLVATGCGSDSRTAQTVTEVSGMRVSSSGTDYVGDGTQTLGSVSLPKGADVTWSCAGCATFRLDGTDNHGPNGHFFWTQAPRGHGHLPPGEYTLKVRSDGHWTVSVSASARPARVRIALAPSPAMLRTGCRRAARRLTIAIYCPTSVPAGWSAAHVCAGCNGTFSATGWFPAPAGYIGQPGEKTGHFTVWAAPPAKVREGYVGCVNGTRSRPTRVGGHAAVWVVCPPGSTLDGGHVLLRWSRDGWLYAVSIHTDTAVNRNVLMRIAASMVVVKP